ncbi:MAG: hypothetical protein ABIP51_17120 [Bacteroidia bacterium]
MKESASLIFPFKYDYQNECLKRATTVEDTIVSSIKAFLVTRKGSRVGSYLGSFLPELLLEAIPVSKLPNLSDELKTELESQFAGVNFLEVVLKQNLNNSVASLFLSIKLSIPAAVGIVDFEMNLPSVFTN